MQQPVSGYAGAAARPVAELLACPAAVSDLLSTASRSVAFSPGEYVFRQSAACGGLYVVVNGRLSRRSDDGAFRISLGLARPGDIVELAAALGKPVHNYSLVALDSGSVILLPLDALHRAFQAYPPLRIRLLEEFAREVSRAYYASSIARDALMRRVGAL